MGNPRARIPLSVPHLAGTEQQALAAALASNWIAAIGPDVDAFEEEFAVRHGGGAALATVSGTAAIHLALRILGVGPGDEVLVSTLTFCASANPILYLGATPVLVDSEARSWNLDPSLLEEELARRARAGRLPKAVVAVHLYGQIADIGRIAEACLRHGVPLVEDAAEALGATTAGDGRPRHAGTLGTIGIFSFDGSKVITTSMGGMLLSSRPELVAHARKLARQAREPVAHYEHEELGYNYRMSNLLAAVGRSQLAVLDERVRQRRRVFAWYEEALAGARGITLQPEAPWGTHARWLTCVLLDTAAGACPPEELRARLLARGIESRRLWKPMHRQPLYRRIGAPIVGGAVADALFRDGLCLPSSSSLTHDEVLEVAGALREEAARAHG
jgi:dTDP-4-amino-4,6-dideoxygalactose transaminase